MLGKRNARRPYPAAHQSVEKPGVVKGPQPLKLIPALTTCALKRMKTLRFSYFAGFAARERMREAKHEKNSKKWQYATFSTLKCAAALARRARIIRRLFKIIHICVKKLTFLW